MINTLLFVHLTVAILLVITILLQKTSTYGLSGIGGGGSNMGVISGRSAASFLTRTTVVLATVFFINALIIANLSSQKHTDFVEKIEKIENEGAAPAAAENTALPIAK
jgi:preprotein translocase subunit SecG